VHQVTRKGSKLGGTYPIYDGREDAIAHGISPERIKHWKDYSMSIGDYAVYPDGAVAEVIRVYGAKERQDKRNPNWVPNTYKSKHITTRLNCYSQSQSTVISTCLPYAASTMYTKPETLSTARVRFAEDWLLGGLAIEASCKKHLWQARLGTGNGMPARTYAYMVLTLPWFDELLKSNRLIRDRYMTLVGALGTVGIDEAYVAEKLKEGIESLNVKEKINALNKVIDLLEINAAKKRVPIQASWSVDAPGRIENNSPKQLPETADINNILEDTLHEDVRIRSGISETKRDTPIFPITSHEEQSGRNSETSRVEAVPAQASN
jgi:hypothetical protein